MKSEKSLYGSISFIVGLLWCRDVFGWFWGWRQYTLYNNHSLSGVQHMRDLSCVVKASCVSNGRLCVVVSGLLSACFSVMMLLVDFGADVDTRYNNHGLNGV